MQALHKMAGPMNPSTTRKHVKKISRQENFTKFQQENFTSINPSAVLSKNLVIEKGPQFDVA